MSVSDMEEEEATFRASDRGDFFVTADVQAAFDKNGYVLVRGLLLASEMSKLRDCIEQSSDLVKHAYGRADGNGRISRMCVWNHPGNDVCGVIARSQKIAGTMQTLLGGDEIYHYHSKLMMKEAQTGGSWRWHQDYGYWYHNGCLYPEMGSIFIPIDRSVRANGCLQVLRGSHLLGRIDHATTGEQAGADLDRVREVMAVCPLVPVEMEPGDVLFFHCNLLHTSDQNQSDMRRYAMITSVNKRMNNPTRDHHHPKYTPMTLLPNSAILQCNTFDSTEEKDFMNPDEDSSFRIEKEH